MAPLEFALHVGLSSENFLFPEEELSSQASAKWNFPPLSPSPKRRRTCQRGPVSFAETSTVYSIPNAKDELTADEFHATYTTKRDLRRIRQENIAVLEHMIDHNDLVDNEHYYFRGLESSLPVARRERLERVSRSRKAVMEEQKTTGGIETEWVFTVYIDLTIESDELAIETGFFDEMMSEDC